MSLYILYKIALWLKMKKKNKKIKLLSNLAPYSLRGSLEDFLNKTKIDYPSITIFCMDFGDFTISYDFNEN